MVQQAGILTVPLYSVHKAISVIVLAKEQSAKLQKSVVPVFWIAGEDHDLEEINHTYTVHGELLKKRAYSERSRRKTMVLGNDAQ
ncbi:bacillithiol biosynthesis BshC [Lysinibacillus fusiformis]